MFKKYLNILKKYLPHSYNQYYIWAYTIFTFLMITFYTFLYLGVESNYGPKYLNLVVTVRTILLALFLIYFYNPLRSNFDYGPALPIFATGAGIALLLTLRKFDILNLVHFLLYGKLIPIPDKPECNLDNAPIFPEKNLQISKTI